MTQKSTEDENILDAKLFDLEDEVDERSKRVAEITLFEISRGVENEIKKRGNKHRFDRELRQSITDSIYDKMKEKKEFSKNEILDYHVLLKYELFSEFDEMELGHIQKIYESWEFKKVVERTFSAMKSKLVSEVWRFIIAPLRILLEFNDENKSNSNELGVYRKGLEIIINEFMIFHKLLYKIRVFRIYFWLMIKEFPEEEIVKYKNEIENIDLRYYFYKKIDNSCTIDMRCNIKRIDYFISEMKKLILTKLSPDGHYALRNIESYIFDKENIVRIISEERKLYNDLNEKFTGQINEIISITSVNNIPNNIDIEIFTKPVFGQVQTPCIPMNVSMNVPLNVERKQQEVLIDIQKTGNPVLHQTIKGNVKQSENGTHEQNNEITFIDNSVGENLFNNSTFGDNSAISGFSGFSCGTTQSGSTNFFSENKPINRTTDNSEVTVNENRNEIMTNNSVHVQTQKMTNTIQQGNVQGIGRNLFGSTTFKEGHQSFGANSSVSSQTGTNSVIGNTRSIAKKKTVILSAFSGLKKN